MFKESLIELVLITRQVQVVVKADGVEVGVLQVFIEGRTGVIYGLNSPKTFHFICENGVDLMQKLNVDIILASCESVVIERIAKHIAAIERLELEIGEHYRQYNKEFNKIKINLKGDDV